VGMEQNRLKTLTMSRYQGQMARSSMVRRQVIGEHAANQDMRELIMRKVVLKMHVSLDGYVRAASGDVMDWVFRTYDDELKAWEVDTLWQAGMHIMGRNLYEEMAAYWPTSTDDFAPPMNEIPKVVFSKTLKRADWSNSRVASGDLAEELSRLRREPGKDILVHGGATFVQSLSTLGLIDEYRLIVHPIALTGGLPLFAEIMDLKLLDSKAFPAGAIALIFYKALHQADASRVG
jgi:dihydrofolate reductase